MAASLIEQIKEEVARDVRGCYTKLWGEPVKESWGKLHYVCPYHNDTDPSMFVTRQGPHAGKFRCFGCGKHGDFIDAVGDLDRAAALVGIRRESADRGSVGGGAVGRPDAGGAEGGAGADQAGGCPGGDGKPGALPGAGGAETRWDIRDSVGKVVATHVRVDLPDGKKKFRWERNGANGLQGKPSADLPLYNTHLLMAVPEEYTPIVLCEGEKAADALTAAGHLALATVTGANALPSPAVLGVLAGRQVVLWPDNDEVGCIHMKLVAEALCKLNVCVAWVDPQFCALPEHGDAADVADEADLTAAINAATPYTPDLHGLVATLADVAEKLPDTTWLWEGWVPKGYLTVLAGTPGAGKSGLALALARCYLNGGDWPDGAPQTDPAAAHRVLWLETEDSHGILRDRCAEWNVPMDRIYLWGADGLGRPELESPATALALTKIVSERNVGLVVLDTLAGAHYQEENSANIKRIMQTLTGLAQSQNIAVLALHHLRKRQQQEAEGVTLDRVRGSSAIAAAARVVLAAWRKPNHDADCVFLSVIKSNLTRPPDGLLVSTLREGGPVFSRCEASRPPSVERPTQVERDVALIRECCGPDWIRGVALRAEFCARGGSDGRFWKAITLTGLERKGKQATGHYYRRVDDAGAGSRADEETATARHTHL